MKVLVVDDELFICELLEKFLSRQWYQVVTTTNGEEAVSKFEQDKPGVVLLDILMSGMSGIEVLSKIKEIDGNTEIIILSALGDSTTVNAALDMGANYYMEKPIEFERLLNILNMLQ